MTIDEAVDRARKALLGLSPAEERRLRRALTRSPECRWESILGLFIQKLQRVE